MTAPMSAAEKIEAEIQLLKEKAGYISDSRLLKANALRLRQLSCELLRLSRPS
jgi:hypothetical protein